MNNHQKREAARDFLRSAVMPLIEEVLVKKFCQTMYVIAETNREGRIIMDAADKENLAIGRAINRAAETLPEGWEVCINIERYAGWVVFSDPDGNVFRVDSGEHFSEQINSAVEAARAGGE